MRISATILILAGAAFAAHADDDDARAFTTPRLPLYEQECGSCHLAYPPGMLPARSWVSMLDGLADHFGQNAELSPTATATLSAYLRAEAADVRRGRWSRKVLRSSAGQTPRRISELAFMRKDHDEISREVWARPAVLSRANCAACHQDATTWDFDEDRARIPR
jgi:hypothetical protein